MTQFPDPEQLLRDIAKAMRIISGHVAAGDQREHADMLHVEQVLSDCHDYVQVPTLTQVRSGDADR